MEDKKEKVLIVEDETKLARFVELELTRRIRSFCCK